MVNLQYPVPGSQPMQTVVSKPVPKAELCSMVGLFRVWIIPAPLALLFGILAAIDDHNHPKKHGMGRAIFGILMGRIFSMVFGIFMVFSIVDN